MRPDQPTLIFTARAKAPDAVTNVTAAIEHHVEVADNPDELVVAVRRALTGVTSGPWTLPMHVASDLAFGEHPSHKKLSDRESEVLTLIGLGRSVKKSPLLWN
jgi:DNA-binding NarL/FixJ family response regulator